MRFVVAFLALWLSFGFSVSQANTLQLDKAVLYAGYLLSIDEVEAAEKVLSDLDAVAPFPSVKFALATVLYKQGKTKEADAIIDALIVKGWRYPDLLERLKAVKSRNALWAADWSYSFQSLHTQNPNKRAKTGTYNLFGWEMNYINPEDETFWGLRHNVEMDMRLPHQTKLTFEYQLTDYEASFADRQRALLKFSTRVLGQSLFEPFVQVEGNWQEGYDDYITSLGLKRRIRTHMGQITLTASEGQISARQSSNSDGQRTNIDLSFRPISSGVKQTYFGFFSDFDLNGAHLRNRLSGYGVSLQHSFRSYFGSLVLKHTDRQFENPNPFWGQVRTDRTDHIILEVCRQIGGRFAFCGVGGEERRNSSIDFYDNLSPEYGFYVRGAF